MDNCEGRTGYDSTDDCCYDPNPATKPPPTTPKAVIPFPIDCKAMRSAENIIRKTRIAYGCNIGNPTISLAQCSEVSCLKVKTNTNKKLIQKKTKINLLPPGDPDRRL